MLEAGVDEFVRSSALRMSWEACWSSSSLVSKEDMDPRLEVEGVVGFVVGGPSNEVREAVELEREGAPPLGVLPGDVTLEGENVEDDAGDGELLRG